MDLVDGTELNSMILHPGRPADITKDKHAHALHYNKISSPTTRHYTMPSPTTRHYTMPSPTTQHTVKIIILSGNRSFYKFHPFYVKENRLSLHCVTGYAIVDGRSTYSIDKVLCMLFSMVRININQIQMLFANKTGGSLLKSKTPQKGPISSGNNNNTPKIFKKEASRLDSNYDKKKNILKQSNAPFKSKTKDSYLILHNLEEIYNELNFNEFDIFPLENIQRAKKNIANLLTFLGDEPICRYHKDLLNLYCENDKTVICVSCVYKAIEHKSHKVKSIESVQKVLDLQTIRNEEKIKSLIHQLSEIKDQLDFMTKEISQNFMTISKYTISVIDESVKELNSMKVELQKKLSLAYRRTTTVISRYNQALDLVVNHLQTNMQKTMVMNSLSKHQLLKELSLQIDLIEDLVSKFNENRQLMEQWNKSNQQFQKVVLRKRNLINQKVDSFVVTQF